MKNRFSEFIFKAGLYEKIDISSENIKELIDFLRGNERVSCYCKECRANSIFSMNPVDYYYESTLKNAINGDKYYRNLLGDHLEYEQDILNMDENKKEWKWIDEKDKDIVRVIKIDYQCTMDPNHHLDFIVQTKGNEMWKIGQYPSTADLTFPELNKYKKVIDEEDRQELGRAIGLFAHGVGCGSYVYLRRVIERLVLKAQEKSIEKSIKTKEDFEGKSVSEKIKELKGILPQFVVENATVYGILSKGIHELSEEDCIRYFPAIRDSIFLILESWEEERAKEEKKEKLRKSIAQITSNINT